MADGRRYLVERLWPRGFRKDSLALTEWLKPLAPSAELRRWYGHDVAKFEEFDRRYRDELAGQPGLIHRLRSESRNGVVTLLYAAADGEHCSATLLRRFLEEKESG